MEHLNKDKDNFLENKLKNKADSQVCLCPAKNSKETFFDTKIRKPRRQSKAKMWAINF